MFGFGVEGQYLFVCFVGGVGLLKGGLEEVSVADAAAVVGHVINFICHHI